MCIPISPCSLDRPGRTSSTTDKEDIDVRFGRLYGRANNSLPRPCCSSPCPYNPETPWLRLDKDPSSLKPLGSNTRVPKRSAVSTNELGDDTNHLEDLFVVCRLSEIFRKYRLLLFGQWFGRRRYTGGHHSKGLQMMAMGYGLSSSYCCPWFER